MGVRWSKLGLRLRRTNGGVSECWAFSIHHRCFSGELSAWHALFINRETSKRNCLSGSSGNCPMRCKLNSQDFSPRYWCIFKEEGCFWMGHYMSPVKGPLNQTWRKWFQIPQERGFQNQTNDRECDHPLGSPIKQF